MSNTKLHDNESANQITKAIDQGIATSGLSQQDYSMQHVADIQAAIIKFKSDIQAMGISEENQQALDSAAKRLLACSNVIAETFQDGAHQRGGDVASEKHTT